MVISKSESQNCLDSATLKNIQPVWDSLYCYEDDTHGSHLEYNIHLPIPEGCGTVRLDFTALVEGDGAAILVNNQIVSGDVCVGDTVYSSGPPPGVSTINPLKGPIVMDRRFISGSPILPVPAKFQFSQMPFSIPGFGEHGELRLITFLDGTQEELSLKLIPNDTVNTVFYFRVSWFSHQLGVNLMADSTCQLPVNIQSTITGGGGGQFDYAWSTGGLDSFIVVSAAGEYTLIVIDILCCQAEDTITVAGLPV